MALFFNKQEKLLLISENRYYICSPNEKRIGNSVKFVYSYFTILFSPGSVVQLVRMPPCHGGGRGFESRPVRKSFTQKVRLFAF